MGKLIRDEPTAVTAHMSAWLSDDESPQLWAPFAFSLRGLAYEVMDESELARLDYLAGLRMYEELTQKLGEEAVARMSNNMRFIQVRLDALPPPSSPDSFYSAAPMLLSIDPSPKHEQDQDQEPNQEEEETVKGLGPKMPDPARGEGDTSGDAGEPPQESVDKAAAADASDLPKVQDGAEGAGAAGDGAEGAGAVGGGAGEP